MTSRKPRLAVVSEWFVPGYKAGGPIRSTANLVAALQRDFDVWVLTSDRDLGEHHPYAGVARDAWLAHGDAAHVMYMSRQAASMANVGRQLVRIDADCIYLNSMFSRIFTTYPLWLRYHGAVRGRMIVAPRGELHAGALRYKPIRKRAFVAVVRSLGMLDEIGFHATDSQEALDIHRVLGMDRSRIVTIPNLPEPPAASPLPIVKERGHVRLAFVARIAPKKNLLFLIDRLAELPDGVSASLAIAGAVEDAEYWAECRRAIGGLPQRISVDVLGAVPHDRIRATIADCHYLALPTHGENYGHSIVEAMGAGRPVIISDTTPWRNLQAHGVGWDLSLDSPSAFVAAIKDAALLAQADYDRGSRAAWTFARSLGGQDVIARYDAAFRGISGGC